MMIRSRKRNRVVWHRYDFVFCLFYFSSIITCTYMFLKTFWRSRWAYSEQDVWHRSSRSADGPGSSITTCLRWQHHPLHDSQWCSSYDTHESRLLSDISTESMEGQNGCWDTNMESRCISRFLVIILSVYFKNNSLSIHSFVENALSEFQITGASGKSG